MQRSLTLKSRKKEKNKKNSRVVGYDDELLPKNIGDVCMNVMCPESQSLKVLAQIFCFILLIALILIFNPCKKKTQKTGVLVF